jgi:CheY-like chemotaxis protein
MVDEQAWIVSFGKSWIIMVSAAQPNCKVNPDTNGHPMASTAAKTVLSLGQCAADSYAISQFLIGSFDVQVTEADTAAETLERLRATPVDLVLVNRILDVDGDSGLDFISRLKAEPEMTGIPVMLVSNHAEAQKQAVARGALPGFGKAQLADAKTVELVKTALS